VVHYPRNGLKAGIARQVEHLSILRVDGIDSRESCFFEGLDNVCRERHSL